MPMATAVADVAGARRDYLDLRGKGGGYRLRKSRTFSKMCVLAW